MRRRLFAILSAFSLLICVLFAALWIRKHWVAERVFHINAQGRYWRLESTGQFLEAEVGKGWDSSATIPWHERRGSDQHYKISGFPSLVLRPQNQRWWDIHYDYGNERRYGVREESKGLEDVIYQLLPPVEYQVVFIPHWLPVAAFGLLPLLWLIAQRRWLIHRRRRRLGMCLSCGYDLRASHDRCPECGTAIPADLIRKSVE